MVVNPLKQASGQLCECKMGTHRWAAARQKWLVCDGEPVSGGANASLGCINKGTGCGTGNLFSPLVRSQLEATVPAVVALR